MLYIVIAIVIVLLLWGAYELFFGYRQSPTASVHKDYERRQNGIVREQRAGVRRAKNQTDAQNGK